MCRFLGAGPWATGYRYCRAMARLLRRELPDGIYHVTARGVARGAIFRDDDDRRLFLRLLARTVERHSWSCHAFCLMGNHYHLVVETLRVRLSAGVQRLNGAYAQTFNTRYGRSGHLFGERFSAHVIESEEHCLEACRYVILNPVRAGLCAQASEWLWSASRYGFP